MAIGLNFINGDFVINPNGSVDIVSEQPKCARDFVKMMQTVPIDANSNVTADNQYRYNPSYGNMLVSTPSFNGMHHAQILDTVNIILEGVFKNYLDLQDGRDNTSLGETLVSIDYTSYFKPLDKTALYFDISLRTANQNIEIGTFAQQIF